jgi:uncharacterized membrane protein
LTHIGKRLPPKSSALLTFAETTDPSRMLAAVAHEAPSVASLAAIDDDLTARVSVGSQADGTHGSAGHGAARGETALTSMVVVRYPDPDRAHQAASGIAGDKKAATQVELVIKTDRDGRRHVSDPKLGVAATAKSSIVSWGVFGVLVGAISGASGGGILEGGVVTGIAWGAFGAFAGALYGLWAGRTISARRLKGIGPILAPGTSVVLAWVDGPVRDEATDKLSAPGSKSLVLRFNADKRGAVLEGA